MNDNDREIDFSKVRLICSDLDGTLLTYHQTELSERFFRLVRELNSYGIIFAAASGRQIPSLKKLFEPVADCCNYICANGAVICNSKYEILDKTPIPRETAIAIARDFFENSDCRGEINVAGAEECHLWSRGLGMVERLSFIGSSFELIEDPAQVNEDIVKVSVFLPDGAEKFFDRFKDRWAEYNVAIAGPFWIDTTAANKGSGVRDLCRKLGIELSEVMAFGDNYNDVSMLDIVGYPYLMSTAADELKKRYPMQTDAVEDTLEKLLEQIRSCNKDNEEE